MRTADQIARICGVSPQAIREWCRKNDVAKGAKGGFRIDESTEARIFKHYGVDLSQLAKDTKANAQDGESWRKQNEVLVDMLRDELEARNRQLEEKDRQIERLQVALDQQQKLQLVSETKRIEVSADPPQEDDPPDAFEGMTDQEIYKIAASKLPKLKFMDRLNDGKIEKWHKERAAVIEKMTDKEKEVLYRFGFAGDGR